MSQYCLFCGSPLPNYAHMNKDYCYNNICGKTAKSIREKQKRKSAAEVRKLKKETESKLEKLCLRFGHGRAFNPSYAHELDIDYSVSDGFITIDKYRAATVLKYAYIIINNENMIIWSLLNLK